MLTALRLSKQLRRQPRQILRSKWDLHTSQFGNQLKTSELSFA
jgi:hypothetical protein